jgi:hypothetical protein
LLFLWAIEKHELAYQERCSEQPTRIALNDYGFFEPQPCAQPALSGCR